MYLNPSFLVKKPNGGFRLVTAFADVGRYSKPQPSLLPDVDSTLRHIAQWKYLIATDFTSAFHQIPLSCYSMKYCGVPTLFRGVRVYSRCAMGMPGSETALEELMCRILGHLLEEGVVAKIADDLYCGGNPPTELLQNWRKVLHALHKCDLRLSASKTIISPQSTMELGWIWNSGTLCASPHRISTLSSCPAPETVGRMRSFIGAFKVLSCVIPGCSSLLAPLDDTQAPTCCFLVLNYIFSQTKWLPFEVEALAIATAIKHFSPYLVQSHHNACILTDSKPCVQAYEKLFRGEFSAGPRVSTFLSIVSRYQASVRHVSGSAILPLDFASRNAAPCLDDACQICTFTKQAQNSVVRRTSIQDRLQGDAHLPFTSRSARLAIQAECAALRRTHAHLKQGARPSRKLTNIKNIKRYLSVATVAKDGLLVVKRDEPLVPSRECIIVPQQVLDGLLTALHIQLNHPSSHQLFFYMNNNNNNNGYY